MKFVFLLLICFLNLNSAELLFKESHKINKDLKLNIYINDDEYEELSFKIVDKNDKSIYEDLNFIYKIYFKKLNDNNVLIEKYSGGNHCCTDYLILKIDNQKIKKIKNFNFGNCMVENFKINKKDELDFSTCDDTYRFIRGSFGNSYFPKLIFENSEISIKNMSKPKISNKKLQEIFENIKKQDINSFDNIHYKLDEYLLDLVYSGNINLAFELFYMYNKEFPKKENSIFINLIFKTFFQSDYFEDILKVNKISLKQFDNLMIKNNIIIRKENKID